MAQLSESVVQDKIEIVDTGTYKVLQVRTATVITRDSGEQISTSFHRHVVAPNSDVSGETDEVKALAAIYFTSDAKAAQTAAEAANAVGE